MGTSKNSGGGASSVSLITVPTANLKERLNCMYDAMRQRQRPSGNAGLFEYLWDLKEMALLENRHDVQVPTTWLEELEAEFLTAVDSESRH